MRNNNINLNNAMKAIQSMRPYLEQLNRALIDIDRDYAIDKNTRNEIEALYIELNDIELLDAIEEAIENAKVEE